MCAFTDKTVVFCFTDLAIHDDRAIRGSRHLIQCKTLWSHCIGHLSSSTSSSSSTRTWRVWEELTQKRSCPGLIFENVSASLASWLNNDFDLKTIFCYVRVCWNQYYGMFTLSVSSCLPLYLILHLWISVLHTSILIFFTDNFLIKHYDWSQTLLTKYGLWAQPACHVQWQYIFR